MNSPFLPTGTVYGVLLNGATEWQRWTLQMSETPYRAAPLAPVLYVKTANTFNSSGATVTLPPGASEVDVGASLALVIGDDGQPAAVVLVNDLSLPHTSYYRPPVKYKNLDGFLGLAQQLTPLADLGGLNGLARLHLEVHINGHLRQTLELSTLRRAPGTLLTDVDEFMTLQPGDLLLLGTDTLPNGDRLLAQAGDHITVTAPGLAPCELSLRAAAAAARPQIRTATPASPLPIERLRLPRHTRG